MRLTAEEIDYLWWALNSELRHNAAMLGKRTQTMIESILEWLDHEEAEFELTA